mmetsp:Transcript_104965/g.254769  ORF Transcript_104965/g.254769 Transcript_104965/m.254769 type:complete len:347 (-) Transcript_104965:2341-3381(-)
MSRGIFRKICRIFWSPSFVEYSSCLYTSASALRTLPRCAPPSSMSPGCSCMTRPASWSCTFLASSSSSLMGSLPTIIFQGLISGGQNWPFPTVSASSAEVALSRATFARSWLFFGEGPPTTCASLLKASPAACEKLSSGAAKLMAYAEAVLTSASSLPSPLKTSGMRQGHRGSERCLRCFTRSQPRYMATTLLWGEPIQADSLRPHSSRHGRNSASLTCIRASSISSQFRLSCSSSSVPSLSSSSSSSAICCRALLAATLSSFLRFSSTCVRCKDWSIKTNSFPTICLTSSALRMPGPAFLMQSAMPVAAWATRSASWLLSKSSKVGLRQARNSSAAAAVAGSPRS